MRRAPRRLGRLVSLVWLLALALAASAAARSAPVRAVGAVGMTVADMDRSVRFYRDVLDFHWICWRWSRRSFCSPCPLSRLMTLKIASNRLGSMSPSRARTR
jgi:hypothetical protein